MVDAYQLAKVDRQTRRRWVPRRHQVLLEAKLVFLDDVRRSIADWARRRLILGVLGLV